MTEPTTIRLLTPPVVEPVTLVEARAHLRLTSEERDDDVYILGLIAAARRTIERRLGITLAATQYRATWPNGGKVLRLPNPPLLVDAERPLSVTVDGTALAGAAYEADADASPATITLDDSTTAKTVVTYWAGVAPGAAIPPQLRSALLLMVGHLYLSRDGGERVDMPPAVEMRLASESVSGVW